MLRLLILCAVIFIAVIAWTLWRRVARQHSVVAARAEFARQCSRLQEDFRAAADVSGKPRGLRWKSCEFHEPLVLARDRSNGELVGLIGATIAFEAVEGGGMEDVEAVGNLRAATAILTWNGSDWSTAGRAVFNLEPQQVLEQYQGSLESVHPT